MIKSIVVPLDGSRVAERAIPVAARLAKKTGATLHLVMAQEPTQGLAPFSEIGPPSVLLMEELDRRHEGYLDRTAARLRRVGVRIKTVMADGAAGKVIARTVKSARAGLVVMSTHGRGALDRFGLGSVSDYLVRHLEVPILLIPRRSPAPRGVPGRRILVPLDLSRESLAVLDVIEALIGTDTRVTLLHIVEPVSAFPLPVMSVLPAAEIPFPEAQVQRARSHLRELERAARRRGFSVKSQLLVGGRPARVILDQLDRSSHDLVALGTHGYGGFRRLLLGSVTNKVIHNARKPVLVIRPKRRRSGKSRAAKR
jgi:nucleotide-binding universal stress UspA family protein